MNALMLLLFVCLIAPFYLLSVFGAVLVGLAVFFSWVGVLISVASLNFWSFIIAVPCFMASSSVAVFLYWLFNTGHEVLSLILMGFVGLIFLACVKCKNLGAGCSIGFGSGGLL